MYSIVALVLAFCVLNSLPVVNAGVYVIRPSRDSTCHGGQNCTVQWVDDGSRPLLSAIGVCTLGLYTGKQQLVQRIQPVDVSKSHSVAFIPNANAGPNSDTYYIGIMSTSLNQTGNKPYIAFSPFFRIDQMSGSFDKPLAAATATIPIPSSLSHPNTSTTVLSTVTVGTLHTSSPPPSTLSVTEPQSTSVSSTRLVTSISTPATSSTATGTTVPTSSPSSGAFRHAETLHMSIPIIITANLLALFSFL